MAEEHTQFDPADLVIAFNGIEISGYVQDTFVNVTWDSQAWEDEGGALGDTARYRNRDARATVELTIMQGSPTNDALSAMHVTDKQFGTGRGPFLLKHLGGGTSIKSERAWIIKPPDTGFAGNAGTPRTWQIRLAKAEEFIGGHTS